jgi:hypothetical protein
MLLEIMAEISKIVCVSGQARHNFGDTAVGFPRPNPGQKVL